MTEEEKDELEKEANELAHVANCIHLENGVRLNKCKAAWYRVEFGNEVYVLLQSYNEIVAFIQVKTQTLYKIGYYSRTTVQHICKFKFHFRYIISYVKDLQLVRWNKHDVDFPLYPTEFVNCNGKYIDRVAF